MRKISTEDVFKMGRIIRDGKIADDIRNAFASGRKEGADAETIGIETTLNILCSCTDSKIEKQLYELLGGICEKEPDAIRTQPLDDTVADIKMICTENNVVNFLSTASKLSQKMS